jgi:thioredoxin 1
MTKPVEVTDANFETEVLKSDIPVLVDFWAEWCGPCKRIAPVLEELASEYDGKIKIVKLDVDSNNATAMQYRIMSIPSLIFFKGGEKVDQVIGLYPKQHFVEKINEVIG